MRHTSTLQHADHRFSPAHSTAPLTMQATRLQARTSATGAAVRPISFCSWRGAIAAPTARCRNACSAASTSPGSSAQPLEGLANKLMAGFAALCITTALPLEVVAAEDAAIASSQQLSQQSPASTAMPTLPSTTLGFGAVRKLLRPDQLTSEQAVVVLLDAKSVLRDIAALASTPTDSNERFRARALWPGFAKRLREVGPAAPLVAGLVSGEQDKEQTISLEYGGKSDSPGLTDELYVALGRVLTISGRTIKPEAQATPDASQAAQQAIDTLLAKVPKDMLDQAQAFRIKRAAGSA